MSRMLRMVHRSSWRREVRCQGLRSAMGTEKRPGRYRQVPSRLRSRQKLRRCEPLTAWPDARAWIGLGRRLREAVWLEEIRFEDLRARGPAGLVPFPAEGRRHSRAAESHR